MSTTRGFRCSEERRGVVVVPLRSFLPQPVRCYAGILFGVLLVSGSATAVENLKPVGMAQREWRMPMGKSGDARKDAVFPEKHVILRIKHTDYGWGFGHLRVGGEIYASINVDTDKIGGRGWPVTDRAHVRIIGPDGKLRDERSWYIEGKGSVGTHYSTRVRETADVGTFTIDFHRYTWDAENKKHGGRKFFQTTLHVFAVDEKVGELPAIEKDKEGAKWPPKTGIYGDVLGAKLLILDNAWVTNLGNGDRVWADVVTKHDEPPAYTDTRQVPAELKLELQPDTWKVPLGPGRYHLLLPPGKHRLRAWNPGYIPQVKEVTVPAPPPGSIFPPAVQQNFRLAPSFVKVSIQVLDPAGKPLPSARVEALDPSGKPIKTVTTDRQGKGELLFQESGLVPIGGGIIPLRVRKDRKDLGTFGVFIRLAYSNSATDLGVVLARPPASMTPAPATLVLPLSDPDDEKADLRTISKAGLPHRYEIPRDWVEQPDRLDESMIHCHADPAGMPALMVAYSRTGEEQLTDLELKQALEAVFSQAGKIVKKLEINGVEVANAARAITGGCVIELEEKPVVYWALVVSAPPHFYIVTGFVLAEDKAAFQETLKVFQSFRLVE